MSFYTSNSYYYYYYYYIKYLYKISNRRFNINKFVIDKLIVSDRTVQRYRNNITIICPFNDQCRISLFVHYKRGIPTT